MEAGVFIAMAELFEPRVRGKYMGILSSMYGLASIAGPLAGRADRRYGGLALDLPGQPAVERGGARAGRAVPPGQASSCGTVVRLARRPVRAAAIVPLTLAFSLTGSALAWFSAPFFGLLALAAAMIALLVLVERRRDHAIVRCDSSVARR